MDSTGWIMWAIFTGLSLRSYMRMSGVQKKMQQEERVFGFEWYRFFFVLLLPWAFRQAEKDYIREQKDDRQGAQ